MQVAGVLLTLLEYYVMNNPGMCKTVYSNADDTSTITITGRFDVAMDDDFLSCYEDVKAKTIILDMSDTRYMDESALGMLLLMRERFGGGEGEIILQNCSSEIKALLRKANYQWFFAIQ